MSGADLVCGITDVGSGDRAVAGGKGAGLGELARAGIPVPPGFVVTAAAFRQVLQAADPAAQLRGELARLPAAEAAAIAAASVRLRRRIASAPLPGELRAAIRRRYLGLGSDHNAGGPRTPVAVRSSATAEDSADASLAGLQDSYLWVRGAQAVIAGVRSCWASLYNTEAVSYRLRMRIPELTTAMGVVVQRMVDARSAGVMFTCSPTSGDRSVIAVEGCWGLGSALACGDVTPDCFVVSKVTGEIVRRTVAAKLRMHGMAPGGCGVLAADVPGPLREQPCLSDDEVLALARLGRRVEQHYGAPQDIEWAIAAGPGAVDGIAGDGIVALQSRPETVWTSRAAGPIAVPRARAVEHVFEQLARVARVDAGNGGPRWT
jgi:pyruvate, water dikinase